jgi:ankyrin repeat protein
MRFEFSRLVGSGGTLILVLASVVQAGDLRLVEAVKSRDKSAVRALLKAKVDVNAPQPDGATGLHWAVYQQDVEMATLLINAGARVDAANDYGLTPLALAATNGSAAMIDLLIKSGADAKGALPTGESVLMTASRVGKVDAVKRLLDGGANVNAKEPSKGQTALMWAVSEDHLDVARLLIASGADVQARTTGGFTPILFAARQGNEDMARLLLDSGADVNDTDSTGASVLLVATIRGHSAFARLLLDRGADPNADKAGYTALHWAAATVTIDEYPYHFGQKWHEWAVLGGMVTGRLELIKSLLAHGADPNARITREKNSVNQCDAGCALPRFSNEGGGYGRTGSTPFLVATANGDLDVMRLLLANGADPRVKDKQGSTALILAVGQPFEHAQNPIPQSKALKTVNLVLGLGVDVNAANTTDGDTALHLAAYLGYDEIAQLLVENGAQLNLKNKLQRTPLKVTEGGVGHSGLEFAAQPKAAAVLRRLGGTSE